MSSLIAPHGGTLINRLVSGARADEVRARAEQAPAPQKVVLNSRQASDFEMIANGGLSPLTWAPKPTSP
jgi:sulfate adenylyltransferase